MIFIGDIHGNHTVLRSYMKVIGKTEDVIQVGDFGIGFDAEIDAKLIEIAEEYPNLRMIRGNHDDPQKIKEVPGFIPDGTVIQSNVGPIMFIGGADSIDKHARTIGVDWWQDEEISMAEAYHIGSIYEQTKPTIVVTHTTSGTIAKTMFPEKTIYKTLTQDFLDHIYEFHKPKINIFGHWHPPCAALATSGAICVGVNSAHMIEGLHLLK